ncbi:hypothetical protein DEO72_LG2g4619 [Vigna unguiculata]|uniref:Uncharacterized protein n=1 Tax=Vigna unguiculata TaxID=3917 RepID=A0A4D6L6Y5_VIGUN|nr:hypothetical protein DEO72_LG2g4619 [Vigna unguiculata]
MEQRRYLSMFRGGGFSKETTGTMDFARMVDFEGDNGLRIELSKRVKPDGPARWPTKKKRAGCESS